jgi:hypothetical protein
MKYNVINLLIQERTCELCSSMEVLLELRQEVGVLLTVIFLYLIYYISFCKCNDILCLKSWFKIEGISFSVMRLMSSKGQRNLFPGNGINTQTWA